MSLDAPTPSSDSPVADEPDHDLVYGIDDKPPLGATFALGFQHYLTMFGSTVAIPLILGPALGITDPVDMARLIGTMFFVSGVTTLIQTTVGNKLPIIQGGTFSFLPPVLVVIGMAQLSTVGWEVRMQQVQLAIIAGAVVQMVIGYSGLIGRIRKLIGPITIAPTIALIGLALFNFGAPVAGQDWWIGGLTIALIILFSQYLKNTHRAFELFPIMMAIVGAWGVASILSFTGVFGADHPSYVTFAGLADMPIVHVPYPFQWGMPEFMGDVFWPAFVGMLAGYLASMIESIGDYYACARLSGAPTPDRKTINRGIGAEGLGCFIAGLIGTGNGTTSYSENIGAIGLTRVGSRAVVQAGALLMLVLGLFVPFGGIFTTIPGPIVGGMYCAMFGMIAAVGLSNLQFVDLNSTRNLFIIGFAFFMGLSMPVYFAQNPLVIETSWLAWLGGVVNALGQSGMAVGALIAMVLDNTVPGTAEERGLTAWH